MLLVFAGSKSSKAFRNGARIDTTSSQRQPVNSHRHQWSLVGSKTGPVNLMLQSLLVERFNLSAHWDTRERAGFALVVAASNGRFGPNLHRSDVDCNAYRAESRAAREAGKSLALPTPGRRTMWRSVITQAGSTAGDRTAHEHSAHMALVEYLELHRGQPDRRSDRINRKLRYRADLLRPDDATIVEEDLT